MSNEVIAQEDRPKAMPVVDNSSFANLLDTNRFSHIYRVATLFSQSGMVPKQFVNNPAACFVGIQMAVRLEVDPFMFLQNIYMSPDGKPALYGQMAIALINTRGGLTEPLEFVFSGHGDEYGCTAIGTFRGGKKRDISVTIAMAKAEGWYGRNPKWRNLTQQMLRYRAGAWFGRAYCPEALMGMQTAEEVQDMDFERSSDGTYVIQDRPSVAAYKPIHDADGVVQDGPAQIEHQQSAAAMPQQAEPTQAQQPRTAQARQARQAPPQEPPPPPDDGDPGPGADMFPGDQPSPPPRTGRGPGRQAAQTPEWGD